MKKLIEKIEILKFWFTRFHLREYHQAGVHRQLMLRDGCEISPSAYFTGSIDKIAIGKGTLVGDYANIRFSKGSVKMGSKVIIAQFVTIIASEHQYKNKEIPIARQPVDEFEVLIEDDVWIGAYSLVRAGIKIGKGAVIGAHSLVSCDVPDYEIWAGIPAKKIGIRD